MSQRKSRSHLLIAPVALASSLLIATAAVAQQQPATTATPSVEGYLCAFAGKCDGATQPTETRDAPETRGFRLARPSSDTGESRPAAATTYRPRAAAAVRPARAARPSYSAKAPLRTPSYGYTPAPTSVAAPGRPRADLLIGFELNSAELTAQGRSAAQVFARSLMMPELGAKRFVIEGHTDLRGGRAVNNALSAKRAQAVVNYLAAQGVARDRLEARGFGSSAPLPGHRVTDPANRRVEAELVP